eukprot:8729138-Pyramimonas_sp.AAC.1
MSEAIKLNGTQGPCYGTRRSWRMGRTIPVLGHAVLTNETHGLGYGTHNPGKWDAQSGLMGHAVPAHWSMSHVNLEEASLVWSCVT